MRRLLFCALCVATGVLAAGPVERNTELQPIPDIQQEIAGVANLLSTTNYVRQGESPFEAVVRISTSLMNLENCSSARLLLQLSIACVNEENANGYTQKLMTLRIVSGHVLVKMPPKEIVAAVAPYYDLVEDTQLRASLDRVLDMATLRNSRSNPDFTSILAYVQQHQDDPPRLLVRYMLQRNPDAALVELRKLYAARTGQLDVEHRVNASIEGIRAAIGGEWWEQLYAAEKMRQNRELRDSELIEQLKKSEHAVVRETVQEIEDEKKKK